MKLLIIQICLSSRYFIPLRSMYCLQHSVLKHINSVFSFNMIGPDIKQIQGVVGRTNRQISFDTTRTALKAEKLRGIHRQTAR
jgi:hypothetical protein